MICLFPAANCELLTVRSHAYRHRVCEHLHEDIDFLTYCFEMLDEDEDELLNEDELRLWIEVLSHGDPCTDEELEEVMDNLDSYRASLDADPTEGVLEISDFLLVTLDFYLATGKTRMRALYTDLILT